MPNPLSEPHLSLLASQFETAWTLWISFYTAVLAANLVAYGLVVEKMTNHAGKRYFAHVFLFMNAQTLITCVLMLHYTVETCKVFKMQQPALAEIRGAGVWACIGNTLISCYLMLLWWKECRKPETSQKRTE